MAEKRIRSLRSLPKKGFYDYKNKYQAGSTVETCPAEIPADKTEEMQRYACLGSRSAGHYRIQPSGLYDGRRREAVLPGSEYVCRE